MKLGNIFRGPKWPRDAAEFIATHFADKSVTEFFDEPRFERFLLSCQNRNMGRSRPGIS